MRSHEERGTILTIVSLVLALLLAACGSAQVTIDNDDDEDQGDTATGDGLEDQPTAEDYYDHWMAEAGVALSEGNTAGALDAYLEAAKALDGSGEVTVKRAEAHFLAADMAYQRVEKELALEQYQASVDIYRRFKGNSQAKAAVALTNMGVIYKEMAEKVKARNCWEQALQVYNELPEEFQIKAHIEKIKQNIRDLDEGF